ncbi:putative acyl-CoA thioester hydrolase [Talaromyces proteolyticus]|uniref:Acyl-CoA thioester hydrolase n=1 Tax=Talaromyces proteolyticus TaxID=1131652 RepID=A0AAD4Q026_9EURO|nr:putative acyl-CoA thioester hydrolase [Talaromyces proteolyticus]KAH8697217.1 putative acyl-CoA thioester hydrolase [Talaromyces proteolyticus]
MPGTAQEKLARSACQFLASRLLYWQGSHTTTRQLLAKRHFHATPTASVFTAAWIPSRVKTPWVDALAQSRDEQARGKSAAGQQLPPKPDLTPKRMSDSYFSAILPLAQDKWLLDSYLNASGRIRLGTLFMDLDTLAGVIAYRHTGDSVTTVTAAADRITLLNPLKEICDLELSGQVTYATGRSSMEISLQVAKAPVNGEKVKSEDLLITCAFTMVSLDPATKKPIPVAPLVVETEEEKRLFQKGEENYNAKKALRKKSFLSQTPDESESNLIHSMWSKQILSKMTSTAAIENSDARTMSSTVLKSAMIMQPEDRNRHNFMIFGGFLLQKTFELAFCCAASFSHSRPTFVALDPSTFENSVPVGSVLYMNSLVAYTEPLLHEDGKGNSKYTKVHVRVDTRVRDVEHATRKSTGSFHYSFIVPNKVQVMPTHYTEYMMWLDARRRAQELDPIIASRFTEDAASARMDGVTE